jgi:fructose-1-phosphate kinase PfkB-like protein
METGLARNRVKTTPAHFYTFTGNLLAERTLTFAAWAPGRTQRARTESFQVGGKGINVARMLHRLGERSTALCFAGGAAGTECTERLRAEGLDFQAFAAQSPTRAGTVVRADGQAETTFLGPDAPPGAAAVRACAEYLDAQPGGVLAVCGSVPGWEDPSFDPFRAALARWLGRGLLIADTYGPPLAWLAGRPLALVKINRAEFDGLFPEPERTVPVADRLARLAGAGGPQAWVVTDGPGPVRLRDEDGQAAELSPPRIREVSATGSGDILLAGILQARWRQGLSLAKAVEFALPYASAHAAQMVGR